MFDLRNKPIHPDYHKYPSTDGEPMAVSTLHFEWLVTIKENLEILTQEKNIFVAGDLLWYPVKGKVDICKAPDVMVAIGRPKGDRLSYLQWLEDDVAPQVVFEVYSKSNRRRKNKEDLLDFYEKYGVEEFYSYDPELNKFVVYIRQDNQLVPLEGLQKWVSPLLKIQFNWSGLAFEILHPDGERFARFEELERRNRYLKMQYAEVESLRQKERQWRVQMEKEAELAKKEAEVEKQNAKAAQQQAEAAAERNRILEEKLKSLGIDPDQL
jgi:Uma2 family endonuclease